VFGPNGRAPWAAPPSEGGENQGEGIMISHDSDLPARQRIGTTLVAMSAAIAGGGTGVAGDDVEILAKVRKAVGWESGLPLVIEGEAESYGSKGRFTLRAGSAGRFCERVEAPLGRTRGDDGATGWEVDASGMPRRLEADERDRARLTTWIWTGQWLDRAAKIVAALRPRRPVGGDVVLEVGMADRPWHGKLLIDGQTWLPRSLTSSGASGSEVVEFSRYVEYEGRKVAAAVASRTGDIPTFTGTVTAIRSSPTDDGRVFAPIERRPHDTHFDAGRPAKVRLERARTGQLLVYPAIDGVDLGAFVLDSGASGTVITPEAATKLGLPVLGVVPLGSMVGTVAAKVHRAGSLTLGPATIKGVFLVEFLLDGRQVARVQAGKLHLGVAEIAWFDLAGHRFERPQVLFALDADGVLGEAGTLGTIGVEFLRPFRIVFDYSRSRIAFIEPAGER